MLVIRNAYLVDFCLVSKILGTFYCNISEVDFVHSQLESGNHVSFFVFLDHSTPRDVHNDVQQEQVIEKRIETNIPVVHVYPSSENLDIVEEGSPSNTVFQVIWSLFLELIIR